MLRKLSLVATVALSACSSYSPPRPVVSLLEQRHRDVVVQAWDVSCGAAALATLLHYDFGRPVTEKDVAADLLRYTSVRRVQAQLGFSLLDLKKYAERHGLKAEGYGDMKLGDLVAMGPSIVPVVLRGFNHFMVYRGMEGDRLLFADPAWGNRTMQISTFLDDWKTRIAFKVSPPDTTVPPSDDPLTPTPSDFVASSLAFLPKTKSFIPADEAASPAEPTEQATSDQPLAVSAAGQPPVPVPH